MNMPSNKSNMRVLVCLFCSILCQLSHNEFVNSSHYHYRQVFAMLAAYWQRCWFIVSKREVRRGFGFWRIIYLTKRIIIWNLAISNRKERINRTKRGRLRERTTLVSWIVHPFRRYGWMVIPTLSGEKWRRLSHVWKEAYKWTQSSSTGYPQ